MISEGKENKERLIVVLSIILYLVLQLLRALSYENNDLINVLGIKISCNSMCGVYTAIQMVILIYLVMNAQKKGYVLSMGLLCINLLIALKNILMGNYSSLPGFCIVLVGMLMINILYKCFERIRKNEIKLVNLVDIDELTGLPNRRKLNEWIKALILKGKPFALIFIDLDNFKDINDTMGHEYGDAILCELSKRWQKVLSKSDFIARLGGDEFALVVNGFEHRKVLIAHVKKYLDVLSEVFNYNGEEFFLSASMGISRYPRDGSSAESLLRYADTAMYNAKKDEKKTIVIFEEEQMREVQNDIEIEKKIRKALKNNTFYLNFQPQYEIKNHKLRGFEALIRMKDDDGKIISPALFIPKAEKSSLIIEIDKWVLENAVKEFKSLITKNRDLLICVNISAKHLQDNNFVADVKEILKREQFNPKNLEIEITESLFINSVEKASEVLKELKDIGIHIALDDFGTGYASLSYLNKLPIDILKIDKSFIDGLPEEKYDFVQAIISMGHVLKFKVISEGVEKEGQLKTLKEIDCDYMQGFIWGKPMDITQAKKIIG